MTKQSYILYHNKEDKILKISKAEKEPKAIIVSERAKKIDKTHYISTSKLALKHKGLELKKEWVKEASNELKSLQLVKILGY